MIELVATPTAPPIEVPCIEWSQVGIDQYGSEPPPIYSAPCPRCQPNLKLPTELPHDDKKALIAIMQRCRVHLADVGTVICSCGAYLKLVLPQ